MVPFDTTGLPPGATFGATTSARLGDTTSAGTAVVTGTETPSVPAAAGPLKVGQAFGPRYHIIKLLGAGGMGAVYQAWDAELNVAVAVKVIRTSRRRGTASSEAEKRFKNELLLARQVTHKNVVRIHDIGDIEGTKYITMSYVQGDDLGSVLRRDGKFPIARALHLARQIAAGLDAAHEAGVVHRDLKPPNIMVGADDQALIMDFGISASRDESASSSIVGTLEYMAPEQSKGEAVDARADIYAFGLILYEMLTGPRGVPSTSAQERIDAMKQRITEGLPPPRTLDPSIPESLDVLVLRCLERDRDARFATTSELCAALARLDDRGELIPEPRRLTTPMMAAAAVTVAMLLGGTYFATRKLVTPLKPHEPMSVLIADFDNRANDPAFNGSVEQALSIALEGASFVTAYPRRDAQRLAERLKPGSRLDESMARLISTSEGIKVVVSGSIDRSGSGYAITVRAIDPAAANNKPLANETVVAADKAQVLSAIGSLAANIRGVLGDTTPESARLAAAATLTAASLDALRAYARGDELNRSGKPREALVAFEEAVRLDPAFATAYFHMASIYGNLKIADKEKANYDEALKHLDRMSEREKLRSLGVYFLNITRNYEKTIETYEELVSKYPSDNVGYANLALAYLFVGNVEQAVTFGRKATEIYPNNILQRTNYATYLMYSSDFPTAIAEAQRVLKENPGYEWANLTLALSTLAQGDEKGARDAYARLSGVSALGASLARMGEADLEMSRGRYATALNILEAGMASDENASLSTNLALKVLASAEAHLALGQRQAASAAATRAAALAHDESVLFPAARVLIATGQADKAEVIATRMEGAIQSRTRSYGRLVDGAIALQRKRYADAVDSVRAGLKLHNSWFAHELLGETYVAAGQFADALAEWELCVKRRGEATDVFFADTSTLRYLPPAYYWLGRAQESLGTTSAARQNYDAFLTFRAGAQPPDPLAADARERLTIQPPAAR